jgi:hypothetical protein
MCIDSECVALEKKDKLNKDSAWGLIIIIILVVFILSQGLNWLVNRHQSSENDFNFNYSSRRLQYDDSFSSISNETLKKKMLKRKAKKTLEMQQGEEKASDFKSASSKETSDVDSEVLLNRMFRPRVKK